MNCKPSLSKTRLIGFALNGIAFDKLLMKSFINH